MPEGNRAAIPRCCRASRRGAGARLLDASSSLSSLCLKSELAEAPNDLGAADVIGRGTGVEGGNHLGRQTHGDEGINTRRRAAGRFRITFSFDRAMVLVIR